MTREELATELRAIVGNEWVRDAPEELLVYETDGLTFEKSPPDFVVFPEATEQVVKLVKLLNRLRIPFVARGMGTGLSGGCLTPLGGVVIVLTRMNRILKLDIRNRQALVEAGVINQWITNEARTYGYHFAPDPASQTSCTVGGNVAENAAGPHTLKYGVTANHVLAAEVVLPNGEVMWLGGYTKEEPGYDLLGLFTGSEGTFGIVTKVLVKLTKLPEAYRTLLALFRSPRDAAQAVSDIIAAGILPAAMEMIDHVALEAVQVAFGLDLPQGTRAVLVIELDGFNVALDRQADKVREICEMNDAYEVRVARDDAEREKLWFARKKAFGSLGRLTTSYCTQDIVVPRTRIPEALERIYAIAQKHDIRISNIFHAGDGNLHPCIFFDERSSEQVQKVLDVSTEIMHMCIEMGGSVTGEHGIGLEKINFMRLMFSDAELIVMRKIKQAFDPDGICNPGKIFPHDDEDHGILGVRMQANM